MSSVLCQLLGVQAVDSNSFFITGANIIVLDRIA